MARAWSQNTINTGIANAKRNNDFGMSGSSASSASSARSSTSTSGFGSLRRRSTGSAFGSFRGGIRNGSSASGDSVGFQGQSNSALRSAASGFGSIRSMSNTMRGNASMFTPILSQYVAAVKGYDPQFLVDQAAMDARTSYDKSKGIMERNMLRYGINPNSGRFAALQNDWARNLAAAEAGAKTKARRQVYLDRISTLGNAAGMGQSYLSGAISGASTAAQGSMAVSGQYGQLAGDSAALGGYEESKPTFQATLNNMLGLN